MVLVVLVSAAAAVVAVARWVLVRRQLRSVADQLRRRREAGVHAPVHVQLVDGAVEALVVQINATIAQAERTGARLRRHERRYRELVADLSHDLRTPLTAVRGYQQMLAASALDPAQRDHLCAAVRHADRLAALVEEVFEYARLSDDAGEDDGARVARVDLVEEVVQCLLGLAGPLEAAGLEVELRAPDALVAETDPGALRRIVANLVRNAVQHGRGRLRVELAGIAGRDGSGERPGGDGADGGGQDGAAAGEAGGAAGRVRLRMRNGVRRPGALDVSRALERGWSSDPAGTGLGLSIVELLAARLGGAVAVGLAGEEFEVVLELPAPPGGRARGTAAIPPDDNPVGP